MIKNQLLCRIITLTTLCCTGFAASAQLFNPLFGPSGSGGGGPQAGDFQSTARIISEALNRDVTATDAYFGIPGFAKSYTDAVSSTDVVCAKGELLQSMVENGQKAFFDGNNTIALDCEHYDELDTNKPKKFTVVFHEYMRKLKLESSEYAYSSKLISLIFPASANVAVGGTSPKPCTIYAHWNDGSSPAGPDSVDLQFNSWLKAKGYTLVKSQDEAVFTIIGDSEHISPSILCDKNADTLRGQCILAETHFIITNIRSNDPGTEFIGSSKASVVASAFSISGTTERAALADAFNKVKRCGAE